VTRRVHTSGRSVALGLSLIVCLVTFPALAVSPAFAASSRRAAVPETAPECFNKLRQIVADLASLERLANDVRAGNVYLRFERHVFYPIDKSKYTDTVSAELLIMTGSDDPALIAEVAQKATASALKKLLITIESGHELVQAVEKRCNDLKNGGSGSTSTGATGSEVPALALTIKLEGATENSDLNTNVQTPPEGSPGASVSLKSGPPYTGSVEVTGALPTDYVIYITYHSQVWSVLPATGGEFTVQENAGFGAPNYVEAVACVTGGKKGDPYVPNTCKGRGATITINWSAT
jgi:hypothetical protein